MKLSALQWVWLMGAFAFMAALLLDIADVVNPPNILWLGIGGFLMIAGGVVLPFSKIREAHRRG